MRIAVINRHRTETLAGSEVQCDMIARGLTERGHEVVYIAANGQGPYDDCPYRVVPVPLKARAIADACERERPDIVYWRLNKHGLRHIARRLARLDIPFVFASAHINDHLRWAAKPRRRTGLRGLVTTLKHRIAAGWNHEGFRWVAAVVTNNPDHLGLAPVGRQAFIANSMTGEARPFSWPRPYVLWVSSLKPAKRPDLCIELARRLDGAGVDVLMVGERLNYPPMESIEDVPANLRYLGPKPLEEVNGMLAGARCLVTTSMPEGFSNNIIQASLQGTPTVSFEFDPGGVLRRHVLGLCSGGDIEQFVSDVGSLLDDEALAQALGRRARTHALKHFDPGRNIAALDGFLNAVAASTGGRARAGPAVRPTPGYET
ncbi:glycosyltransferase family 4 protein [Kaustia mangrovi]|uniref:Glycosyltransferase family 4 protein n=1 Tax=Kaustia mangrovi TaxID=2593653 RepID=A0A7S8C554_9HYPH|nr:glycosyltransferase family 4 protein [Kaustia mangrovi]QPC43600.1 glycosyltransferase family 4 protein [Kaustia mangrovi]